MFLADMLGHQSRVGRALRHAPAAAKDHPLGCAKNGEIIHTRCRQGYKAVGSNLWSARRPAGMTGTGLHCAEAGYTPVRRLADACLEACEKVDSPCNIKC